MKLRDSNMELLRIVAMLLVMFSHAGFMALGVPTMEEEILNPMSSVGTFLDMALSIVCVNIFVLISGWFGIKSNNIKLKSLFFQVFFFSFLAFGVLLVHNPTKYMNFDSIMTLFLLHGKDYWFIKSYFILCLLSPIINKYLVNLSKKELRLFLISFYGFQTIYAWLSIDGASDFVGGYSVLSFIGLYLLARYFRLYCEQFINEKKCSYFIMIFFVIGLFQTTMAYLVTRFGLPIAGRLFTYTNPLVIIQATSLLLAFSRIKNFHNRVINWVASSCLAAYLLHANDFVLRGYYAKFIKGLYNQFSYPLFVFYTSIFIILVFLISVSLDKIRIYIWNKMYGYKE